MARATCYYDPALDAPYPARWPAAAEVRLRDGRTFAKRIEFATGEPENPVSREGLIAKFASLTADRVGGAEAAETLARRFLAIDAEPSLKEAIGPLASVRAE
jgi:2-methylcitrate dehydratase PrpD